MHKARKDKKWQTSFSFLLVIFFLGRFAAFLTDSKSAFFYTNLVFTRKFLCIYISTFYTFLSQMRTERLKKTRRLIFLSESKTQQEVRCTLSGSVTRSNQWFHRLSSQLIKKETINLSNFPPSNIG